MIYQINFDNFMCLLLNYNNFYTQFIVICWFVSFDRNNLCISNILDGLNLNEI